MMTWASFSEVDISATWRLYLTHVEAKGVCIAPQHQMLPSDMMD